MIKLKKLSQLDTLTRQLRLAFAITEEAIEDNLYDRLASRYTKALARSMAQTKQVKAAAPLNNGLPGGLSIQVTVLLCLTLPHPTIAGTFFSNTLATAADLNETSLEQALIDIAALTDERGLKIAAKGMKNDHVHLHYNSQLKDLWLLLVELELLIMISTQSNLWG